LQFYQAIVAGYKDDTASLDDLIFRTHEDVFRAVLWLWQNPGTTRREFNELISKDASTGDLLRATNLSAKLLTMVDCSVSCLETDRLEKGNSRISWRDDVTFHKYLRDLFPTEITQSSVIRITRLLPTPKASSSDGS